MCKFMGNNYKLVASLFFALFAATLPAFIAAGCSGKAHKAEPRTSGSSAAVETFAKPHISGPSDIREFYTPSAAELPDMEIAIDPATHPRLLADEKGVMRFGKASDRGPYEKMMTLARLYWMDKAGSRKPADSALPGILSAAALLTANDDYFTRAIHEIDNSFLKDVDFTFRDNLERASWAAIGWDLIWPKMSEGDRDALAEDARLAIAQDILPVLAKEAGGNVIKPGDISLNEGVLTEAYSAIFLWEMARAVSLEKMKELLEASYPVLYTLQEGLRGYSDRSDFIFIDGPIDDGFYLACQAWERASGAKLIDRDLLHRTLDDALQFTRKGFETDGAEQFKTPEGRAALMHLVKWRNELTGGQRVEVDGWVAQADYTPDALMHLLIGS
jgi:hypothetical protein